jgi:hypothetical protein
MWNSWEKWEMHTVFSWENLNKSDHFADLGMAGTIILKYIFKK